MVQDMFDLNGKVALVTGAGGLLGKEFSLTLAEAGAALALCDVDEGALTQVTQRVDARDGQALAVPADITQPASVESLVDRVVQRYDRLDILVNSAAVDPKFDPRHAPQESNAFETYPLKAWNQALETNLTGMFLTCQAAVQPMLDQGGGVMINLSSIYGIVGPDQGIYQQEGQPKRYKPVHYSVTKAGVLGLTRYLAAYYGDKNIRVNALSPGGVYHGHDEAFVKSYAARTLLGRMAEKDELNGALLFLASDASSYMTGANLIVDGGWTAW